MRFGLIDQVCHEKFLMSLERIRTLGVGSLGEGVMLTGLRGVIKESMVLITGDLVQGY